MKIKIWNAFASNNSGSYTIVGSFREPRTAEQVARELAELCAAHTEWYGAHNSQNDGSGSPLHQFILRNGLKWEVRRGAGDDWPQEYGHPPTVGAVGHQVIVHVPYTITMPPTFANSCTREAGGSTSSSTTRTIRSFLKSRCGGLTSGVMRIEK